MAGLLLAGSLGAPLLDGGRAVAADPVAISVDFTAKTVPSPAERFGFTFSTFGVAGGPVATSPADIAALTRLGAGTVRLHLEPSNGTIVSGAGGGDTSITGDRWLDVIDELGAEAIVIVNADQADAVAVLRYLTANGHPVRRFIIGNEMDSNSESDLSPAAYTARFRSIARAMREITPGLQIGGPAPAWFDTGLMRTFIDGAVKNAPAIERASFIDYHAYGSGAGAPATMAQSVRYASQIRELRRMIGDPSVGIQVGEFNMNWGDEPQNNTHFQSVWNANAFGTIVSEGATALLYADKNDAMGLVGTGGARKASYVGMEMFTGQTGGLRHFGSSVVRSTSSSPDVRVYASADRDNIVVVNSGASTTARIAMTGAVSGTVEHWRSAGADDRVNAPVRVSASAFSGSAFSAALPAMSISTFVVDPAAAAPTPAPAAVRVPGLGDPLWRTAGSATRSGGTATLTTTAQKFSAGSVYFDRPLRTRDLDVSFTGEIGAGAGADGMTLSFLDPESRLRVGGIGGGLGFSGLTGTAVAVDTFDNERNRSSDAVAILRSTPGSPVSSIASTTAVPDLHRSHRYRVRVVGKALTVAIDGVVVMRRSSALPDEVVLAFTAGTGSTTDLHRISNVSAVSH